jgi:hypothetical protein
LPIFIASLGHVAIAHPVSGSAYPDAFGCGPVTCLLDALFLIDPFAIDTLLPIVFKTSPIAVQAIEQA